MMAQRHSSLQQNTFIYSLTHHVFLYSFIYSFIYSFLHSLIYLFILCFFSAFFSSALSPFSAIVPKDVCASARFQIVLCTRPEPPINSYRQQLYSGFHP